MSGSAELRRKVWSGEIERRWLSHTDLYTYIIRIYYFFLRGTQKTLLTSLLCMVIAIVCIELAL